MTLANQKKLILEQLGMITKIKTEFAKASLDAGADGIFLATQHFNESLKFEVREELEFDPMKTVIKGSIKRKKFLALIRQAPGKKSILLQVN